MSICRRALAGMAVGAVLAFTLTPTSPTADTGRGPVQPAPVVGQYQPFGLDNSPHAAFPLTTRLPDGRVRIAWRESSGHLAGDGRTVTSVGDPVTGVWSTPTEVVLDTSQSGRDMRPAALSTVGDIMYLTYFFWQNGVPAGAYVAKSVDDGVTWGSSVRVDGGRPYAAVSAPLVKIGNKLVIPWYGRNAGETRDTAWISTSVDGGVTWVPNRIANALHLDKDHNEPWAVVSGNKLVLLYRDGGWYGMAARVSPDFGSKPVGQESWGPSLHIIDNATGNPASVWTTRGDIYVVYRHTATRDAMAARSPDGGVSWYVNPIPVLRAPAGLGQDSLGMTYAAPLQLGDGLVWCPIGMEQSLTASRIYTGWL